MKKGIKQNLITEKNNLKKLGDDKEREDYKIDVSNRFAIWKV